MIDYGAKETDELLAKMEKRMNKEYYQAEHEMNRKLKYFLREYNEENKQKKKDLKAGTISQSDYDSWLKSKAFRKKQLTEMVNTLAEDHTLADVKAMSIVRGFMPEAYAINRNFAAFQVEKDSLLDTSFTLYDAHTVQALVRDRPNLLPAPSPDIPKDLRWHKQKITNAITQGILQGESIQDIATRLQDVTDMDRRAAIRNARTATTAAQNKGRIDSYKDAEKLGIKLEQEWLATLDGRTRHSHRILDGERAKVGEKFSNGCKYPGDPEGRPEEIYNCRCTLVAAIESIDQSDAPRNSKLGDMSYEEWKYGNDNVAKYEHKLDVAQKKLSEIGNKTYSGIWKNDVTLADYASKKDSIQGKKDFYNEEVDKLTNDPDYKSWMPPDVKQEKINQYNQYLKELEEFEKNGALYVKYQDQVSDLNKKLKEAKGITSPFTPDAYTQARESAARRFTDAEEADKFLRPELDKQWVTLKDQEKYSVWKYTENSNPLNKPISGYEDSWDRYDFKGVGKADWGHEDAWRTNPSNFEKFGHADGKVDHAAAIRDLTTAIDKCELADDMWFVRGSDNSGLAGLLEGDIISFDDAKRLLDNGDIDTLKQICDGQVFQSHSFLSTGIASGTGFSGEVLYDIYAPQGTHCIYAEPQSYFGRTHQFDNVLYQPGDKYSGIGGEAETIFQRGSYYRVHIEKNGWSGVKVTMEVVDQPDYFKTGLEQTFDNGKTSFNYKGK